MWKKEDGWGHRWGGFDFQALTWLSNKYKLSFSITQPNLYYMPSSHWIGGDFIPVDSVHPLFHSQSSIKVPGYLQSTNTWLGRCKAQLILVHVGFYWDVLVSAHGAFRFGGSSCCFHIMWVAGGVLLLSLCSARSTVISATLKTHMLRHCDSIFSLQFCWARRQWVSSL